MLLDFKLMASALKSNLKKLVSNSRAMDPSTVHQNTVCKIKISKIEKQSVQNVQKICKDHQNCSLKFIQKSFWTSAILCSMLQSTYCESLNTNTPAPSHPLAIQSSEFQSKKTTVSQKTKKSVQFFEKNADLLNLSYFDVNGKEQTIREYLSHNKKPVLLVCWASWCGPCHHEMPSLAQMVIDLKADLNVLAIAIDDIIDAKGKLKKELKQFSLPLYYSPHISEIMTKRKLQGVPSFILLSPEGRDLWTDSGAKNWADKAIQKSLLNRLPKKTHSKKWGSLFKKNRNSKLQTIKLQH